MGNKNARSTRSLGDLRTIGKTFVNQEKASKQTESPASLKALAFKSYRQGTLITQNFEPTAKKSKPLCATSPEFIPALPVKDNTVTTPSRSFEAIPKKFEVPGIQKFQAYFPMVTQPANAGIRTPVNAFKPMERANMMTPPYQFEQTIYTASIPQPTEATPNTQVFTAATPYRPLSATFNTPIQPFSSSHLTHRRNRSLRADKSLKDIIISRHGITHNIIPNISSPSSCSLIDILRSMSGKEREEFWSWNWVEIGIDLNFKEGEAEGYEKLEKIKNYNMLIQNLELLGPEFKTSVQNMLINIIFPEPSPSTSSESPTTSNINATSHTTPEFMHLTELVTHLSLSSPPLQSLPSPQPLSSLQTLTILLTVPNSSKPLSLSQLTLLLPFYDLPFTSWTIKWRTSFMTRAEPVGGWPVHYLDKERNRLLRERERERVVAEESGRGKRGRQRNGRREGYKGTREDGRVDGVGLEKDGESWNGVRRGERERGGGDKGRENNDGEGGKVVKIGDGVFN
ncbi:hypothetical protein ACMFMG_004063 [Clarireedia jacksonii]